MQSNLYLMLRDAMSLGGNSASPNTHERDSSAVKYQVECAVCNYWNYSSSAAAAVSGQKHGVHDGIQFFLGSQIYFHIVLHIAEASELVLQQLLHT
jgi:hypothetical protein